MGEPLRPHLASSSALLTFCHLPFLPQGYQAPYDNAGYNTLPTNTSAAVGGGATPPYAAAPPAYTAVDHNTASAVAFYGQQGAYSGAPANSFRGQGHEQQL